MPTNTDQGRLKFERGEALRLAPHREHCADASDLVALCRRLRSEHPERLLAADLFSGAGGMSLGLEDAGMRVIFGADFDTEALETHRHHFAGMAVGWDLGDPNVVDEVGSILRAINVDVLGGGPPCQPFSKAGRSGMRHLVREGIRDPHDKRKDLWQSYLEIVRIAGPKAVIMENVPDMALDREMFILRSIVRRLEDWGYSVKERVVDTYRYGVPQFRQRLILVAIANGVEFNWPPETTRKVTLSNAISDLPSVDPRAGWLGDGGRSIGRPYSGPKTDFQRAMRRRVSLDQAGSIHDHITRRVRADDEEAFEHLDTKTKYSELPEHLRRYRDDIFDDKYKRLDGNSLSRTITAHISKDGYWYIHPRENRTLTIREAARIQTFPDDFRFAGPPTAAFRQIGNAVPPRLAQAIGAEVQQLLKTSGTPAISSRQTGDALAHWFSRHRDWLSPWLRVGSRWMVIVGETILGRESETNVRALWPHVQAWSTPQTLLDRRGVVEEVASWIGRTDDADALLAAATHLVTATQSEIHDNDLESLLDAGLVSRPIAELAMVADPEGEEPVIATAGALRVAGRYIEGNDRWLTNRNSDGRIAVARLIGFAKNSRQAQLGLIELGNRICTPKRPDCRACPLSSLGCTAFSER